MTLEDFSDRVIPDVPMMSREIVDAFLPPRAGDESSPNIRAFAQTAADVLANSHTITLERSEPHERGSYSTRDRSRARGWAV